MNKGFVFGKFLPFHKGHEAMIRFALNNCDFLTILVCCSDKEGIPNEIRKRWIEATFKDEPKIEVRIFSYLENELPNTSVSSQAISKLWSSIFKALLPDYSLLVTSEPYGEFVAEFMNIRHLAFDIDRAIFPVSATAVRRDLFSNWHYLPNSVKPYFAIKVVLLGTESTGKTTLAEKLGAYFNCTWVAEAARAIIPNSNSFDFEDLYLVAKEHARSIDEAVLGNSPLIIIDTDIHITKSYSKYIFKKELDILPSIYDSNKAALYLYLNNDIEYLEDDTRLDKIGRHSLDLSHRQILAAHQIDFIEIDGNWNERFKKIIERIEKLISTYIISTYIWSGLFFL